MRAAEPLLDLRAVVVLRLTVILLAAGLRVTRAVVEVFLAVVFLAVVFLAVLR